MPPRPKTAFVCQQCGFQSPKWIGRCPSCDGWNTFVEERLVAPPEGGGLARVTREPIALGAGPAGAAQRPATRIGGVHPGLGGGVGRGPPPPPGGAPAGGGSARPCHAR